MQNTQNTENTASHSDDDAALRPHSFADYIGQRNIIENLRSAVVAAWRGSWALDHFLFAGPPGLGKTSLAGVIAAELNARFHITSGPAIEHRGQLAAMLAALEPNDVLFIDEIHRLAVATAEVLYSAMEDFRVDMFVGRRAVTVNLPKFTLLGATTQLGLLPTPLQDRFGYCWQLQPYSVADLEVIVTRSAKLLGVKLGDGGATEIARRSRGTPRIANRLLRRARDLATEKDLPVNCAVAAVALDRLGLDSRGLTQLDRAYLKLVTDYGPVGVEAICTTLGQERSTIEETVEPFLTQQGWIARTLRGRTATAAGRQHLEAT